MLGILKTTANRWYVFGKLNLRLVFDYFSSLGLLKGERPRSYYLHTFYLCALAGYFLVQKSYCVDLRICTVAYELKRGNLVGLILAETLNSLLEEGSKLLCKKFSSYSGIIPNFFLSSQPSGISLILHGLPFGFQPIEALYIVFHHFFFFLFFSLMLSTFFFPDMATIEASVALTSYYAPQHLPS